MPNPDQVAFSSDYDEFDHVYEQSVSLAIGGLITSGNSQVWAGSLNHGKTDALVDVFISQTAAGYTGYEEASPPHEWIWVAATGASVPPLGIDAHIALSTSAGVTDFTVRVFNGTGSDLTVTTNTLTFRFIVTDVPWD